MSVVVLTSAPATSQRLNALQTAVGPFATTHRFSLTNGFAGLLSKAQIHVIAWLPGVVHIEENSVLSAANDTAQQSFGVTSARSAAGVEGDGDGNAASYSPSDLVAAVIDTGIDAGHVDLNGGKVLAFQNCVGGCRAATAFDDHGHGTHVAGTIAGEGEGNSALKGAAPGAALVGVKVLNAAGNGSTADITAGIDWVTANKATYGIEAINLSLSGSGCSDGTDSTSLAVNRAHAAGIVVAVAAGNAGPGTCTISSPSAAADALTVGAMADLGENGFKQAYFSSRGRTLDGRIKPDVSGPGVSINSVDAGTSAGYTLSSGTSMAAPFVAGTALLMLDANPSLSPGTIKSIIMSTAIDWGRGGDNRTAGTTGPDIDYGAGRLDGYAAIQAAKGQRPARRRAADAAAHALRGDAGGQRRGAALPDRRHRPAVPDRGDDDPVESHRRVVVLPGLRPGAPEPERDRRRAGVHVAAPGGARLPADRHRDVHGPGARGPGQRALLRRRLRRHGRDASSATTSSATSAAARAATTASSAAASATSAPARAASAAASTSTSDGAASASAASTAAATLPAGVRVAS